MMFRFLAPAALVGLLLSLGGVAASAVPSLTLAPAVVPLRGAVGQTATHVLTLRNDSDVPMDFALEAQDVVLRDGKRVYVAAGDVPGGIAATAIFAPRQVRVPARSSTSVTATFTLPPAVANRAVVAYFRGTTPVAAGRQKALMSLGTLFTFALSDQASVVGEELVAQPPSGSSNARVQATLFNNGTEPVVPTGVAAILSADGRLIGKAAFVERRLLPGERTTVTADYAGDLRPGSYRTVATFNVAGRPLALAEPLEVP